MSRGVIEIAGARIAFRNFAGNATKFKPEGIKTFALLLDDPGLVDELIKEGWNIKFLKPRDEESNPQPYLSVEVSYKIKKPIAILISESGKTMLDEDSIANLDFAEIKNVDLVIQPYFWEVNKNKGVKAYLKSIYVTIKEDEFASKYFGIPESDNSFYIE